MYHCLHIFSSKSTNGGDRCPVADLRGRGARPPLPQLVTKKLAASSCCKFRESSAPLPQTNFWIRYWCPRTSVALPPQEILDLPPETYTRLEKSVGYTTVTKIWPNKNYQLSLINHVFNTA